MMSAGVPILRALELLAQHSDAVEMAHASGRLGQRLAAGASLPLAMKEQGPLFGDYPTSLVRIGCATGSLVAVLDRLAGYEQQRHSLTGRVRAALIYPCLVLVGALILLVTVPPLLLRGLSGLIETNASWMTRVTLTWCAGVTSPWFWLALAVAGAGVLKLFPWKRLVPHLERLAAVRTLAVCRFARALELLILAGCPLTQALPLAAEATASPLMQSRCQLALDAFVAGQELKDCLQATGLFPKVFLSSVEVGLERGDLAASIAGVTRLLELELESRLEALQALLEPLVLLLMGAIVGFTILSVILPLLQAMERL